MKTSDLFTQLRDTLDDHHDRRERLVKQSRDITVASKRMIFALHRLAHQPGVSCIEKTQAAYDEILAMLRRMSDELQHSGYYRYERNVTPAMEEFVEAAAYRHYLGHGQLLSLKALQEELERSECKHLVLTATTYLLGIADFTGELMRRAINAVADGDRTKALEICAFLRPLVQDYKALYLDGKEANVLKTKMSTMSTSMAKVEQACCSIFIRQSEFPDVALPGNTHFIDNNET